MDQAESAEPARAAPRRASVWSLFGIFSRITRSTVRTRSAFREISVILNALRAPLVVSLLGAIVFGFPGQIREIYRLMAEAFDWQNQFNQANLRFILFFVLLYVTGYALWYVSRVLTLVSKDVRPTLQERDVDGVVSRWAPRTIGAAPAFAAAYGMVRAEMQRPSGDITTPGLYGAAAIALLIGLLRLWASWRRTRHNRQLYEHTDETWMRVDIRLALSLLLLGAVAYLMTQPVVFVQWMGTLSIICFFMIALVYGWAHLTYLYDQYAIPALTILIGAGFLWSLLDINDNHFIRPLGWTRAATMADATFDEPEAPRERTSRAGRISGIAETPVAAIAGDDAKPSEATRALDGKNSAADSAVAEPRVQTGEVDSKVRDLEQVAPRSADAAAAQITDAPLTAPQAFRAWYYSRADRQAYVDAGKDYPVYIVAAQGGGMYAAYQTASFLARLQDECPNFAQHVFAISGVSGGSVGASIFTSLTLESARNIPVDDASPCGAAPDGRATELSKQVDDILSQDFLSPLISGALFGDFTARFSPTPIDRFDRARALELAFESAWVGAERRVTRALVQEAQQKGGQSRDYRRVFDGDEETNPLTRGLLSYWKPDGAAPALFFNTTQVENGERMILSPIPDLGPSLDSYAMLAKENDEGQVPDIRLSTAMVLSARFPYITPAASMALRNGGGGDQLLPKTRLVDGGYFENSGIETAFDVMQQLDTRLRNRRQRQGVTPTGIDPKVLAEIRARRQARALPVDFRLIILNLTEDRFRPAHYSLGETMSPVKAILNSRVSRAQLAEGRAREQLNSPCRYMLVGGVRAVGRGGSIDQSCPYSEMKDSQVWSISLNDYQYDFQLGWLLSRSALNLIRRQLGDPNSCNIAIADPDLAKAGDYTLARKAAADDQVMRHNSCISSFILEQLRRGN